MATQPEKRRRAILAVLLALIAAGSLCVWGAAAAGYSISSPVIDAIVSVFTPTDRIADGGGDGEDTVDISLPGEGGADGDGGDGDGDGDGEPGDGDGGDADGSDGSNCLLGIICLNAGIDASTNGGGDGADGAANISLNLDASTEDGDTNCFLGLICITAHAATQGGVNSVLNATVDDEGIDLNADADVDDDGLLDGVIDTGDENGCFLGILCLDADVDLNSEGSNVSADATIGATLNSWWNAFLGLFASAEAG